MTGRDIKVDLKSNIDHSHLDFTYYINKAKNDSKLIEDMVKVRKAKNELREFESKMGEDLPNRKKLKEFREFAKNIIENKPGVIRSGSILRSEEDEKRLTLKIRDL